MVEKEMGEGEEEMGEGGEETGKDKEGMGDMEVEADVMGEET